MLKYKLIIFLLSLKTTTCNCSHERQMGFSNARSSSSVKLIGTLPSAVSESSGIQWNSKKGYFISHNDGGNAAEIYFHNKGGELLGKTKLENLHNKDWEDITTDKNGNLYIGDFGNNRHNRKDLVIYKLGNQKTEKINFRYANQSSFPASKAIFDCEALFWHQDSLYIFTKSWERNKKLTQLYVLSDKAGDYTVSPTDRLILPSSVTAADINPEGTLFALQTYGKILFFGIENEKINFSKPLYCRKTRRKQTEALSFRENGAIIFTNEQGFIYELNFH